MKKLVSIILIFIIIIYISIKDSQTEFKKLPKGSNLKKFNSVNWKNDDSINPDDNLISDREKMLHDLVNNILPNKSKEEIEKILGLSLNTPYFKSSNKDLIYYLGPERDHMMNIDSEWLLIWLDKSNKFEKYKIVND